MEDFGPITDHFLRAGVDWEVRKTTLVGQGQPVLVRVLNEAADGLHQASFLTSAKKFYQLAQGPEQIPGLAQIKEPEKGYKNRWQVITLWKFSALLSEKMDVLQDLDTVLCIGEQLAATLLSLHQKNFLYLSLCPPNIALVEQPGDEDRPVETRLLETETLTELVPDIPVEVFVPWDPAHANYCAPEQRQGKLSTKADVYSLGALLYELWRRLQPNAHIIAEFLNKRFFLGTLEPDPDKRWDMALTLSWLRWLRRIESLVPRAGQVPKQLDDTYKIRRLIGIGGMGVVFEAVTTHGMEEPRRALKFPCPGTTLFQKKELVALVRVVKSTHVVRVYTENLGRLDAEVPFWPMEFLDGESLRTRLDKLKDKKLPLLDAIRILEQCARGMQAVHDANVVHRDLKPDNIMIVPDPTNPGAESIKLIDFGIAKLIGDIRPDGLHVTQWGEFAGTRGYIEPAPPGQRSAFAFAKPSYDVYSLACIFFELLYGHTPVEDRPIELPLEPAVDERIGVLILEMAHPSQDKRPTMHAIATRLQTLGQQLQKEMGHLPPPVPTPRRWRAALLFSLLAVSCLLIVAVYKQGIFPGPQAKPAADLGTRDAGTLPHRDLGAIPTTPAPSATSASSGTDNNTSDCVAEQPSCHIHVSGGIRPLERSQKKKIKSCLDQSFAKPRLAITITLEKVGVALSSSTNESRAISLASCVNRAIPRIAERPKIVTITCKAAKSCD